MLPIQFFYYNIFFYDRGRSPFESHQFITTFIVSNLILICFYYLNSKVLIPKLLAIKKIWKYIGIVLLCFFIYLTAIYLIRATSAETRSFVQSVEEKGMDYSGFFFFFGGVFILFLFFFL